MPLRVAAARAFFAVCAPQPPFAPGRLCSNCCICYNDMINLPKGRWPRMKKLVVRFQRDRALEHIEVLVRAPRRDAAVTELLERLSGQPPDLLRVTTADGRSLRLVMEDIIAVSVRDKLTLLLTEDGAYTLRQSLQSLEQELDPERFLRISRHELVNTDKILKYEFTVGGTLRLELVGGTETWASRRCIPAVRRRLAGR